LSVQSRDGQVATVANSTTSDGLPMKLLLADNPSSQPRELLQLNIGFTPASWSPTRDQLAFYSYAGVYVLDIPTGNYRDFIQGLGKIMTVHWSPDGNYVSALFGTASARKMAVADIRSGAICGYGSDNLPHRYVHQPIRYRYIYSDPQWSPTGNQAVFSSGAWGATNLILITMPG
jgi:Tol biopolymer transport system component